MAEHNGFAEPSSEGSQLAATQLIRNVTLSFLTVAAMLGLFLVTHETSLVTQLPAYPAVVASFLVIVVAPGLVLQAVVLQGSRLGIPERLAVAVPMGLGVVALPGLFVLERHLELQDFAWIHAIFATVVCGAAMLLWRRDVPREEQADSGGAARYLLLGVLVVVLAGAVTTPLWGQGRISGDFDDWTYLAYVNSFTQVEEINAEEPFLGTGDSVNPRMRSNIWVLAQALVADTADVPPHETVLEYLRPLLIALAALATFTMTVVLFRNVGVALLAAAFQLGYGLIDLSAHEGLGRNLFIRISEDKMVAAFLIFPIAIVFLTRYLERPGWRSYAGFATVVLGLSFVHPVPLMFIATTIAFLAALRFFENRSLVLAKPLALLTIPVGLAAAWPLVQRQLLVDVAPELFGTKASAITFRDEFHVVELGAGLLMGNYHMIFHPLMIAAILLCPLVWLLSRAAAGRQVVVAMTAGSLVVFFVPLFATPVAEILTPQTLWKMPWMIPVGPILALAVFEGMRRLPGFRVPAVRFLAPVFVLVGILAVALIALEQYDVVDNGSFYTWTSEETVVPWGEESIFLGGLDRSFARSWRVPEEEAAMLSWIARRALDDSVLLAEPAWIQHVVPGLLDGIHPVDFGGSAGEGDRREGSLLFARGDMSVAELEAFMERYHIDFIVARELEPSSDVLRESDHAVFIEEFGQYLVYSVR